MIKKGSKWLKNGKEKRPLYFHTSFSSSPNGYKIYGPCSDPYWGTCPNQVKPVLPTTCVATCDGQTGNNKCYVSVCEGNKWVAAAPCSVTVAVPHCVQMCMKGFHCGPSGSCVPDATSAPSTAATDDDSLSAKK